MSRHELENKLMAAVAEALGVEQPKSVAKASHSRKHGQVVRGEDRAAA